jgi:hypothetical protein
VLKTEPLSHAYPDSAVVHPKVAHCHKNTPQRLSKLQFYVLFIFPHFANVGLYNTLTTEIGECSFQVDLLLNSPCTFCSCGYGCLANASFSLTLARSPKEREDLRPLRVRAEVPTYSRSAVRKPSPWGEGRVREKAPRKNPRGTLC